MVFLVLGQFSDIFQFKQVGIIAKQLKKFEITFSLPSQSHGNVDNALKQ